MLKVSLSQKTLDQLQHAVSSDCSTTRSEVYYHV